MDRLENSKRSIQDEHLDMLIRLAYQREEEQLCQMHEENEDDFLVSPDRKALTYAMVLEKMAEAEKERVKTARIQKIRKHLPRLVNIAACLVIILCIAAPIAVAKVEYIRVQVMKLLIDIQADHTRLSLVEDETAEFYVPDGWKGEYFPSYIPEGFQVVEVAETSNLITLKNSLGRYIHFAELEKENYIGLDTEGAEYSCVLINGTEGLMAEKPDCNMITWNVGDSYFLIMTDLSIDVCMEMASGLEKIIP